VPLGRSLLLKAVFIRTLRGELAQWTWALCWSDTQLGSARSESVLHVCNNLHDCSVFICGVGCYSTLPWTEPRTLITFQTAVFIRKKRLKEPNFRVASRLQIHCTTSRYGAKGCKHVAIRMWKFKDNLGSVENIRRKLLRFVNFCHVRG
jgi:hypothetical protein